MPDQYQREIEDILKKAEADAPMPGPPPKQSLPRMLWQYARQSLSGDAGVISPGRLMLAALAMLLAAFVLRWMLPVAFGPLAWAGLIVFIVAYAMFFVKPSKRGASDMRGGSGRKMWRGKYIDDDEPGGAQSLKDRVRRIFRR